jgi:hypothetical protein
MVYYNVIARYRSVITQQSSVIARCSPVITQCSSVIAQHSCIITQHNSSSHSTATMPVSGRSKFKFVYSLGGWVQLFASHVRVRSRRFSSAATCVLTTRARLLDVAAPDASSCVSFCFSLFPGVCCSQVHEGLRCTLFSVGHRFGQRSNVTSHPPLGSDLS